MKEESNMNLLFEPRSIAVVGASSKPGKIGFSVVRNLSMLRLEIKMGGAVQPAMWDRLLGLPIGFFRRFTAGDLVEVGKHMLAHHAAPLPRLRPGRAGSEQGAGAARRQRCERPAAQAPAGRSALRAARRERLDRAWSSGTPESQ